MFMFTSAFRSSQFFVDKQSGNHSQVYEMGDEQLGL